jgi:hypothetical protein
MPNARPNCRIRASAVHFVFVLVAACMSLLAVMFILREHKVLRKSFIGLHLGLSILAVIES